MRVKLVCIFLVLTVIKTYAFRPPDVPQLPNFDIRDRQKEIVPSQTKTNQTNQLLTAKGVKVILDKSLGSPIWLHNPNGFLNATAPSDSFGSKTSAKPLVQPNQVQIIKDFVDSHKELFQHSSELFTNFVTQHDYITSHNNVRTIVYQQVFKGLKIYNARFIAHIDANGRIAAISSLCIPSPETANLNNNQQNLADLLTPHISLEQALQSAAENLGCKVIPPITIKQKTNNQFTLTSAGIRGESIAEFVWFPFNDKKLNLAYEFILTSSVNKETFRIIVDANSGDILLRQGLTKYIGEATYHVYTNESPTPMNPGFNYPTTNQPPMVERALITLSAINTNASPIGWFYNDLNQTTGNNADAYLDINADDLPDTPRVIGSPQGVFDFPLDLSKSPYEYSSASVVNLFYWVNFAHDKFYELGFTEESGNFQNDNFGKSGFGNDALKVEAQDGDGYNNSNMTTPPDGNSPRMQMFIFTGPTPYRDGSLDAEVILHEFTHGVSDRLVGGGAGLGTLQSLGMGEGWSDFYAIALITSSDADLSGVYPMAPYVTYLFNNIQENYYYGMRRYPYSINMNINPLTFKDIDPTQASNHTGIPRNTRIGGSANEVHNIGEVWCSVLWEVRAELIKKYGFSQGNFLALRLIIDGMKYSPINPNFLEERDAILLADRLTNGGNNQKEIWRAFAKRGMGFFAVSPESNASTGIVEDYSMPDDLFVTPTSGFSSSGNVGGPFTPSTFTLTLTNTGSSIINWCAVSDGLIELSQYNGTLQPSGLATYINISFNSAVVLLQAGIYESKLYITNLSSGITQTRTIRLLVGQKDYFVEMFDSYDNDLDFMSIIFTPDGSPSYYTVCKQSATNFPTDPADGVAVSLNDDTRVRVALTNDMQVQIYNAKTNAIWIGANGDVSFAQGDTAYFYPELTAFYEYPRVAPLYVDLNPATGGTVSYKILTDRIAVTWQNVPEYGRANRNSFQAELFTNGVIRITWLNIETLGGMTGLSAGGGVPQGLVESDFSNYPQCGNSLKISLPATAQEGDGIIKDGGLVSIPTVSSNTVNIQLISTDTAKLIVPQSITINPGSTSAVFDISIVDNDSIDGTQYPQVIAHSDGFTSDAKSIAIFDNESNEISVKLPEKISESDSRLIGEVYLSHPSTRAIALELYSDNPDIIRFSGSPLLFIPAGKTNATFTAMIIDDDYINGDKMVVIDAKMTNWLSTPSTVVVQDNEGTNITLVLPNQISEGYGYAQNVGFIYLEGLVQTNLTVFLYSDNPNKIQVPDSITILSNDMEAVFDIFVPDNDILDGTHIVTITAEASGFSSATSQVAVIDNELPIIPYQPNPPDNSKNIPLNTILSWHSGQGEQILNGDFEQGTLNGWTTEDDGFGGWMLSDGTLNSGTYGVFPKLSGEYSMWLIQFGFGAHRLWQDVYIPDTIAEASLEWNHTIINNGADYNSNNYFKVEILNTSNQILKVIYSTDTNTSAMLQWVSNRVDLSQFRGKTIRIAFTEKDSDGNIFVGVDDVSLILNPTIVPVYDVFLSTNSNPQTMQLIATTVTNSLSVSNLSPTTTYYWRVVSRYESAQVSSPVWKFTTSGTNISPQIQITSPAPFTILPASGTVQINCQVIDPEQSITTVGIYVNNNLIKQLTNPPYQTLWTNNYPGKYEIVAVAIDKNGITNYSSPSEVLVGLNGKTDINLIPKKSVWRYLDDGSNQGTSWRGYYFDDTSWKKGNAPLGYGFGDEATVLNYGIDPNNKYITYYFRNDFTFNYILDSLILKLRRDDGAVVYINGWQILVDNMPSGTISYNTPASSPTTGDDQFRYFTYTLNGVFLAFGKNVVAVEVHQSSPDSSDLIFDMELSGVGNYPPVINLKYPTNDITIPYNKSFTIEAEAYDKYGSISKVEFYTNSVKVGEAGAPPYKITIPNPPIGFMSISARAIDNLGTATSTGSIVVYVVPLAISNYHITQNGLVIEWSTNFPATVETTTNLISGQWLQITNQIFKTNDLNYIVLPYIYPQQYFRLKLE